MELKTILHYSIIKYLFHVIYVITAITLISILCHAIHVKLSMGQVVKPVTLFSVIHAIKIIYMKIIDVQSVRVFFRIAILVHLGLNVILAILAIIYS
jgi:hypothetical protein